MFLNKYKPKLEEIPHQREIQEIINTLNLKKPILIYGPTGIGKTTAVLKIAEKHNYELLEVNASDKRNKEEIESLIGNATKQKSLFGREKLILVDEIDGVSGTNDRGGIQALVNIIENTQTRIVMTCNNIGDEKLKNLKKKCKVIEFKAPAPKDITNILKIISNKEGINFDELTLSSIGRRCNGDIRAAITDLQVNSILDSKLDITYLEDRNPKDKIENALMVIFKSKDFKLSSEVFTNLNMDLDECFLWIEYNLAKEYTKIEDVSRAVEKLSKSDIFRSRIIRRQYFRFLIYQNILMSAGIALAKTEKYPTRPNYQRTSRLLKTWMANQRNHKRKTISEKFGAITHVSKKEAFKTFELYHRFLINESIISELELSDDEISYLKR